MEDCLFYIQYHKIIGCILSAVSALPIGKYSDMLAPRTSLSLSYLASALTLLLLSTTTPSPSFSFYLLSPLFHLIEHAKAITTRAYALRMFPKEIRSILLGNLSVGIAALMPLVFVIYDRAFNGWGSSYPFIVTAAIDGILFLAVFALSWQGLLGQKEEQGQ